MITNMKRIMRNGVPHYVAPWYSTLTTEGKAMIGCNGAMTSTPRKYLTKMDFKPRLTNYEFMMQHCDDPMGLDIAPQFFAIAAE